MSKHDDKRIDTPTGTEFVGHEWDGIEELNTPLPRWWLWTFYATIAWSAVYVVLYPAWPMVEKATEGTLGWSSRGELAEEVARVREERAGVIQLIADTPIERLPDNPELHAQAIAAGAAAFKIECVQCHGAGAAGYEQYGYPNLNDDDWIWGGDLAAIEQTLTHGIRWEGSGETRLAYMPSFDGIFQSDQVDALVGHVLSFTGKGESTAEGAELFAQNCSACHQADGRGDPVQGAPALNDAIWLYGDSPAKIRQQILYPSHGVMPGWKDRLDPATIKMLAAYVHSRGGGQTAAPVIAPADVEPVAEEPMVEGADEVAAAAKQGGDDASL
ncbi:MAG: cytochrome-c oxidase, cbb3-type subunit III [Pseudomonadota bacterium]